MKKRGFPAFVAAAALGMLTAPRVALGFGVLVADPGEPPIQPHLDSVVVSLEDAGRVHYFLTGHIPTSRGVVPVSVEGRFDPVARRAVDSVTLGTVTLNGRASCVADPWLASQVCSDVNVNPPMPKVMGQLSTLPSAEFLNGPDRERIVAEYRKALDKQNALRSAAQRRLRAQVLVPPTPTRSVLASASGMKKAGGVDLSGFSSPPAATPTPKYPPYGAVYTGGAPPATMKAGQTLSVFVTVQNTSSQTWPAGGSFHLSFHWYRGGAQIVRDGDRTFLPVAVTPGVTINLTAKVTAPPTTGAATLQWDMVQENVTWFSDKGVAMSAPKNVNVTP